MIEVRGIWLPDGETEIVPHIERGPLVRGRGTYQYRKYVAALGHVRHRRRAVDAGAHVGTWARVMGHDFGEVVAFEPVAAHRACFRRNVETANVILIAAALGEGGGTVRIGTEPGVSGASHVAGEGEGEGEVAVLRALDGYELGPVDLLKIDVEGYELPAVRGAEATIRREKPVIVIEQKPKGCAERYGWGRFDALELLQSWGARVREEIAGDYIVAWD